MAADRIPEGFQQTEVGVIPGDWKYSELERICQKINVGFVGTCEPFFTTPNDGILLIRTGNLQGSSIILKDTRYVTKDFHDKNRKSQVFPGDILVARHGSSGHAVMVPKRITEANTLNIVIIKVDEEKALKEYIEKAINSSAVRKQVKEAIVGSTQGVINTKSISDLKIPLPPTLAEQTAIAAALSDMDALTGSLERLIGKKRAVKQGAMQELLRPKEPWVEKPLKMLTNYIASGKSDTNPTKGTYPIYGSTGIIGSSLDYDYSGRKILIARVGANAGKVNKVDGNYCVSDNTLIVDITDNVDLDFIYHYLINLDLNKIIFGSGQPLITGGQLKELLIFLPPNKTEQTAIARALSDMDAEIEQLEAQLTKYRRVKEGMMQELLTGKKRLV